MEVVCLRPQGEARLVLPEHRGVAVMQDVDALSSGPFESQIILLDSADKQETARLVEQLRSHPQHYLKPLFADRQTALASDLIDGPADDPDQVQTIGHEIMQAIESLGENRPNLGPEDQLLRFLYTRPEVELIPSPDWTLPQLYTFPVNAALMQDPSPNGPALMSLLARGFVEPVNLVDRIRLCPQCVQAQLLFVDLCPNCNDLDIAQTEFLHCFTCGHVDREERFTHDEKMMCPRCRTTLRLIGTDYDRPLENFSCASCQHQFIEPEIKARCLGCEQYWPPGDLVKMNVHQLRITQRGRMAARTGSWGDIYKVMDHLNFADIGHFTQTLNWQIKLARRHPELSFGMICLRMQNVLELVDSIGQNKVSQILDTFAERVRQLVRTTDLISRSNEQLLWLLLPQTRKEGCSILLERLLALRDVTRQPDGQALAVQGYALIVPDELSAHESAKSLMARVAGSF